MKISIRTKLIGLIFSIILLVGGTISIYAIYQERKQSLTAYASENLEVVALLSELLLDDLDFNDLIGIRQRLMDAQAYPRILYVYVMDPKGTVLADGSGGNYLAASEMKDPFNKKILSSADWITDKEESVLRIGGPVYLTSKKPIAYLAVGFSLKPAYQRINRATIANLAITGVGLGIGAILAVILATRITRPISEMVEASRQIGEGNFDTRLPADGTDELGYLAATISQMAVKLKTTTISKAYVDEIIQSLSDSLIVLTAQETIQTVNPATLSLLDYEEAELIGEPIARVFHGRDNKIKNGSSVSEIDEVKRKGSVSNVETIYWTKDGYGIPVLFSGSTLLDGSGQARGIVCVARDITYRKRSEQLLRNSEQRYRSLIEAAGSVIIGLSLDHRIVEWNREAESAYGWTREEALGNDFFKVCSIGKSEPRVAAQFDRVLQGRATGRFENLVRHRNGTTRVLLWNVTPLVDPEGQTTGVITVGQDISDLKRAEEALRVETRNLLREKYFIDSTINSLPGSFYLFDQEGRFLRWNETFEKHSEYSTSEIKRMKPLDFFLGEEKTLVAEKIQEVFTQGEASVEASMVSKSGKSIPYFLTGSRIEIDDSVYLAGMGIDISRRKEMEEALRESEERHRSLTEGVLDSSEVGIFILDSSFRVVWLNQAMARYAALRREDVIGKDKKQLIRSRIQNLFEDPEGFLKKVFATYANNTYIENFECHVLANDRREERWLEHWSQPIRAGLYAGGRIEHYYDITERKRAEEALRQSELQVRRALEEREQLGRDLHDGILQSLFAVNLGLEASKSLVQEKAKEAVRNLDQAIAQLKTVMREVRQFITGAPSRVSYEENFEENVRSLVQNMTAAHSTCFSVDIDKNAAKNVSHGQAVHLLNVIREGISNTLRHAHAEQGKIVIAWKNDGICLELSDDGVGFDDGPTTHRGHGLDNMKARARLMGGQLEVFCDQGHGTRIMLEVPYEPTNNKS